jgi:hypothetical protein
MVCGWVLICDESHFKDDYVVCPRCDPKLQEKMGAGIGAAIITMINNFTQLTEQQQFALPTEQQQISPPIEEQQQMSPPNGQPKEQEQILS